MLSILKKVIKLFIPKKSPKYRIGNVKNHNSLIDSLTPNMVEIGDNFISAPGSIVLAHDASVYYHSGKYRVEKTVIGNNVFLGANSTILPGVTIGDNAIIGAGSVVTKNVVAYSVVCGNPARHQCTVDEYVNKCIKRDVLVNTPEGFKGIFSNASVDENMRFELQENAEIHFNDLSDTRK